MSRKKMSDYILKYIEKISPGSKNKAIYQKFFDNLSDKKFDEWVKELQSGESHLMIVDASFDKSYLSVDNNIKVGKELGHEFFEQLWIEEISENGEAIKYLTPQKHLILKLPVRRPSQLITKKLSVPDYRGATDNLTGQVAGSSQSSRISLFELQILMGIGLDDAITEMMKPRGGDIGAGQAMDALLTRHGNVSLATVNEYSTGVESTNTLRSMMNCMHLANEL